MARMNVVGAIAPAFQYMQSLLFRPFDMRKWLGLGFVVMLGGVGGGLGLPGNSDDILPNEPMPNMAQVMEWMSQHMGWIVIGGVILIGLVLLAAWIGSVMQLVYIDQIARNHGAIKEPYARLQPLGTSWFLWILGFGLASMAAIIVLVVLPLVGIFPADNSTTALKGLGIAWSVIVGLVLLLAILIIGWVGSMFVPVAMYVRGIRVLEAWKAVLPVIKQNPGQMLLLALIMLLLWTAEAIVFGVALLVSALVVAIPAVILYLLGLLICSVAGPSASLLLIILIVVLLPLLVIAWLYSVNCAIQPVTVFIRAYSMFVLGQAEPELAAITIADGPAEVSVTEAPAT